MEEQTLSQLKQDQLPQQWKKFANEQGIREIYFINNGQLKNSFHFDKKIYLNIRKYNWKHYQKMIDINSYEEAMTCKFLHEIAHIVFRHKDIGLKTSRKITENDFEIAIEKVPLRKILEESYEKEAWNYVIEFRKRWPEEYTKLVGAFRNWLQQETSIQHKF